jgi:hypothetical protein
MMLRIFCAAVGLTLVCYTLFSYEDAEKNVQNWFEKAWVALADEQTRISLRINSFLRRLLSGLDYVFSRIYGERLFSVEAYFASLSLCLSVGLLIITEISSQAEGIELFYVVATSALFFILPFMRNRRAFTAIFVSIILIGGTVTTFLYLKTVYVIPAMMVFGFTGPWLLFGTIDFAAIITIRKAFRVAELSDKLLTTLAILCLGIVCGPLYIGLIVVPYGIYEYWDIPNNFEIFYGSIAYGAWSLLMSLSIVAVVAAAAFGRLFYAIAPRVIYLPIKLKLVNNRKATVALGVFLIGIAFPEYREAIDKIEKLL